MIRLYSWPTPNGLKARIMLTECGVPFEEIPVDISKGEQRAPEFAKISPNNKIPVIVDAEGPEGKPFVLFESVAILIYLAEKTGKFLPKTAEARALTFQWLMFGATTMAPMLGQAHHFLTFGPDEAKADTYSVTRYKTESAKVYAMLDKHLAESTYLAGPFGIADINLIAWVNSRAFQGIELSDFPNVARWFQAVTARPGVAAALGL